MVSAEAPGAEVETLRLAVYGEGYGVNIRHPEAVGMPLGVTHIMSELRRFTTKITFQFIFPLTVKSNFR